MPPVGVELLARWREAGCWWTGEAPLECAVWRDKKGVRRQKSRRLPAPDYRPRNAVWAEDNSVEITLRPRRVRDEKVSIANGLVQPLPELKSDHSAPYVPLHVLSGYSFGRSVLFAREVPRRAASFGAPAVGLADRFALTGAVEFARECRDCGVKPLVGASFEMAEGGEVVLFARDKEGYVSLSRLVTECHLQEPRLNPLCTTQRLERHCRGLLCLTGGDLGRLDRLVARGDMQGAAEWLDFLVGLYGRENVFVEVERSWLPWGMAVERRLDEFARTYGLVQVAGGCVTHASESDFPAQDLVVCAESLCTVDEVTGRKPQRHPSQPAVYERPLRSLNAERRLRTPAEAGQLFRDRPALLEATRLLAQRCDDDVLPGRTRPPSLYPDPVTALRALVWSGAKEKYGDMPKGLQRRIAHETDRIARLGFADHFLVAWDACNWARERGVLFSGRGSVVDSVVSYCLGFSRIDAYRHRLHFDRFLPEDGSKRPDIDIDFEAKHRDSVREYMTAKYGRDKVATVAAIGTYCTRGIVREAGKCLGLSPEAIGYLAKRIHGGVTPDMLEKALEMKPELRGSGIEKERFEWLFRLAQDLADVPRNIRAHSSGVVVSATPLAETVPVMWSAAEGEEENLRIIQWDKRSAKHYFDKFDILCLRGQDVLSGTQERMRVSQPGFDVQRLPLDDQETYRAMRSGELIGIPQSASPAMRQAHMRLRTADLHDASLVQAGIRPGVGGAVKLNELIARRRGKPFEYVHPELEAILGQSYGIVVFQEQIDQLLQVFCGYSSGEAEDIRDEIHKRRREDYGQVIRDEVMARVVARGNTEEVAAHVFDLIAGFKGYGFAQGHALAFAEISIRSIWCQQNCPAPYFAALLDAQPAGYYGPCTLANEARSRGVAMLPVDVNLSTIRFKVEDVVSVQDPKLLVPDGGLRVGLSQVEGLSQTLRERTVQERESGGLYRSFADYVLRTLPERDELERLVLCGAFDPFCPNRRSLLWAVVPTLDWARRHENGLWQGEEGAPGFETGVTDFNEAEKAVRERSVLGMDVQRHLVAWEREHTSSRGAVTTLYARGMANGQKATVVGHPIRLRFPPTPSGKRVVFFDLEDETGLLNVTCFDAVYQKDGHSLVCTPYVTVVGEAQVRDGHTAFLAKRVFPYRPQISRLANLQPEECAKTADFLVS